MSKRTAKLKVKVLAKHISKGKQDSSSQCPICLAVLDMRVGVPEMKMDPNSPNWVLTVDNQGDKVDYIVPFSVDAFCEAFDKGKPVSPFTFIALRLQEESEEDEDD